MELALLVWFVDLLSKLGSFSFAIVVIFGITGFVAIFVSVPATVEGCDVKHYWKKYFPVKSLFTALLLVWLIPSEQTMKYIAAGYLIQNTFESDFTQEAITLSQKAAIKQLQVWSEGDSDIQELIKSVNLPLHTTSSKDTKEKLNNE